MNFAEALKAKIAASYKSYRQNAQETELWVSEDVLRSWADGKTEPNEEQKLRLYDHFRLKDYGITIDDDE